MDVVDDVAATNLQEVFNRLQTGPWNTGIRGQKGSIVTEPLDPDNPSNNDSVKRYTDRYLRHRKVGRDKDSFAFNPKLLPRELHKSVKLHDEGPVNPILPKRKLEDRIELVKEDEGGEKEDDEIEEEQEEDEFEEMEDDDYNAEKYFDDGDDFGDADDGDNEAAY